ncbi:MAG TPA: hypothetical protein VGL81_29525 [Polyangiaceae bacterium]|jgi:hypothetical protein
MSRSHRNTVRRTRYVDFVNDETLELHVKLVPPLAETPDVDIDVYVTLDEVMRRYRWQLVGTARFYLGQNKNRSESDAEDLVQDLCVEVLEGELALSLDPLNALEDLQRALIERCKGGGR